MRYTKALIFFLFTATAIAGAEAEAGTKTIADFESELAYRAWFFSPEERMKVS